MLSQLMRLFLISSILLRLCRSLTNTKSGGTFWSCGDGGGSILATSWCKSTGPRDCACRSQRNGIRAQHAHDFFIIFNLGEEIIVFFLTLLSCEIRKGGIPGGMVFLIVGSMMIIVMMILIWWWHRLVVMMLTIIHSSYSMDIVCFFILLLLFVCVRRNFVAHNFSPCSQFCSCDLLWPLVTWKMSQSCQKIVSFRYRKLIGGNKIDK